MLKYDGMFNSNIENIVRRYVNFRHGVGGRGWNIVFCEVCGDGSRTKGPRGGWMFTDAGQTVFYHCFNCGCNVNFSLNRDKPYSKGMREAFESFGIPLSEINAAILAHKDKKPSTDTKQNKPASTPILPIPDHFSLLKDASDDGAKLAKKFLKDKYCLSTKDYSFYYATGITKSSSPKENAIAKSLAGRLIIPYFRNGSLIYYQARDVTDTSKLKYISPDIPKASIIFNYDQLYRNTSEPLYVTEGAMDAIHVNGVAVMGNELSSSQKRILADSKREKILIPDFNGDSSKLCEQFIRLGWSVSFPNYRTSTKDVSAAVCKYGKLYTAYDIVTNIKTSNEASVLFKYMNVR